MKIAAFLIVLATPAVAQDFNIRTTDTLQTRATLSDLILDRELTYFDGGMSLYATGGTYKWVYSDANGGSTHTGVHDIQDNGTVCIAYDSGSERCDMFVMAGDRLTLLTDDGQRYPVRTIQ